MAGRSRGGFDASAGGAPGRFSTRRRLIAAFSALLAAFVSCLVVQLVRLRRMEKTFAAMKAHEEQMLLALQLEDAVRDHYPHHSRFAPRGRELDEYDRARARILEVIGLLGRRVDEPDAVGSLDAIRAAVAELDGVLRAQAVPAAGELGQGVAAYDRSSTLVLLIERNIHLLFGRLQQETSTFRSELMHLERAALRWTVLLLVATPVFVAAAVLYLSRSVAGPLARLGEGAKAIAGGQLDARIDIATPDEFGALAAHINAMTVALKGHHEKLAEAEKLAGIGRLAAGVAHELNNPLQVMLGYLTLDRDAAEPRMAEHLAAIEDEARRCKDIVDGLLELSRPPGAPTQSSVDLRVLCDDVARRLRVTASAGTPRIGVEGAAVALADRLKLRQVVFNLMKNAVEAAGAAGDVDVRIETSGDVVEVAVRDSGPGLGADARARLFEPFFTTKPSGTGLGLAVSRAIALAHGGDILVQNGATRGAVFTLRLPRAPGGKTG
jgi:two-component system, NtrC family, sensor kinase